MHKTCIFCDPASICVCVYVHSAPPDKKKRKLYVKREKCQLTIKFFYQIMCTCNSVRFGNFVVFLMVSLYSCFLCKALKLMRLMMWIFKLWYHLTVFVLVLNVDALFYCCQHGSLWLTRFWISSLWGTSITGNLIWDFVWHCLPDLISHVHTEHKVVKCNACQTKRKSWKTVTKLLKLITSKNCRCLHLYSHMMNICIIGISILQWKDWFWVEFSDKFYLYGVWTHKMPGGGVQYITPYIETSSTLLKIWCLVHPDCKEDDGSFVLCRCNQLWEICQQITASRPATFSL